MKLTKIMPKTKKGNEELSKSESSAHSHVYSLIPKEQRRFLFRVDHHDDLSVVYLLTDEGVMPPERFYHMTELDYPQVPIQNKQKLLFATRFNAITMYETSDGEKKKADIVQHRWFIHKDEDISRDVLAHSAVMDWFQDEKRKNGLGFELSEIDSLKHQRHDFFHKENHIRYNSIDLQGELKVLDKEQFLTTLRNGFGRERSFGNGLIILLNS